MEPRDDDELRQVAGLLQVVEQLVALGVDVRRGFMRDLPGGAAQADPPAISRYIKVSP
jgi:hypothetical protein